MRAGAFANAFDDAEYSFTTDQRNCDDKSSPFLPLDDSHSRCCSFCRLCFRTERQVWFKQSVPFFFVLDAFLARLSHGNNFEFAFLEAFRFGEQVDGPTIGAN